MTTETISSLISDLRKDLQPLLKVNEQSANGVSVKLDAIQSLADTLTERLALAKSFNIAEDLDVVYRGTSGWSVIYMSSVISRDLARAYEPMPSSRTDDFIATYRFSLDEAFALAVRFRDALAAGQDI